MSCRFLCVITLSLGVLAVSKPQTDKNLICHGPEPSDCYPKLFVPSDEFQIIHDDQEIPKGLHIRMDFQTGRKEAKLYDPSKDTDPVNAVEVVADDSSDESEGKPGNGLPDGQQILDEMRKTKNAGSIKPPPASSGDAKIFDEHVAALKKFYEQRSPSQTDLERGLRVFEELEELCHDIYWGLRLVKDTDLLHKMYSSITLRDIGSGTESGTASLLATALQNNQAALEIFYDFIDSTSGHARFMNDLAKAFEEVGNLSKPAQTRYVSLLSRLLSHDSLLADFVVGEGLQTLDLAVAEAGIVNGNSSDTVRQWNRRLRQKAANLVADHIIGDAGARDRFVLIHEPEQVQNTDFVEVSPVLKRALADKSEWCWVLNTAFTIWAAEDGLPRMQEPTRYSHVPEVCDYSQYLRTSDAVKARAHDLSTSKEWVHSEL